MRVHRRIAGQTQTAEDAEAARAYLAARTRDILAAGLGIIRVDAPTHM